MFGARMSTRFLAIASTAMIFAYSALAAEDAVSEVRSQSVVTTKVQSGLPKYNPPKTGTMVDRREIDRPRNTIIRLPKDVLPPEAIAVAVASSENNESAPDGVVRLPRYDVREHRLPNFKEREILTPTARVDLYLRRHPGLRIGNLFGWNRGIASAMIGEEDAIDRRREMADLLALAAFADSQPRPKDDGDSVEPGGAATPIAHGK